MRGKISNLDNLLKAGVNSAEHVIVVKEASAGNEVQLADCDTIITVQKIHKMFPKLKLTTELIAESNMRFMEFDANDQFALQQSKFEKKERQRGSSLAFMFRLPCKFYLFFDSIYSEFSCKWKCFLCTYAGSTTVSIIFKTLFMSIFKNSSRN
jgi:hypothetical protein